MLAEKSSGIEQVTLELVWDFIVVKRAESETRRHEFKSQFLHLLAVLF